MSAQHTPGPWRAEKVDHRDSDDYEIRAESGALIAETFELIGKHRETVNQHDNARRIVACVNAMSGIPTEDIEQGQVLLNIGGLYKQRDELLAALDGLCGLAELRPGHLQDYKSAVLAARAAIAKAES